MKNMYCSVLCLEKNRVPNKRENTDVVRTKCVKITDQDSHPVNRLSLRSNQLHR